MKSYTRDEQVESDVWLLHEAIDLCQEGEQFYAQATLEADDYNIKRVFIHMSDIRKCMLSRLTPLLNVVKPSQVRPIESKTFYQQSSYKYYAKAELLIHEQPLQQVIAVLVETEQQVLTQLKHAAKKTNNQRVAGQLAEGIAWLQMSCDTMKSLSIVST
ncbi:glutamyl-tRNA reductase [Shewanella livingstonensis]|uniref:Glutamyl-tRNA reductase n=1 Tax=Shewanella livingstonensis TaxID=150120 RepID=A0A3G8LPU7_9GAMM|nr:glutamyl-tRNA reductase [Shewanella livingstonensis]AZG71417.1 glutamyl-tRNA reductase [Shewanella livingstonensis]